MSALEAARIGDEIGHTSALAGLIVGALAAAAVAVAVVAIVGTGGMAAVAVGAGIAAAAAGGGLGGAYIGELIPTSPTGAIFTGSFNVFIGSPVLGAARASIDMAACSGVIVPHATPLIAQGSSNVFINNMMAARRTDKLVCGAAIAKGCPDVFIGGGTANVPGLTIDEDVPHWLKTTLVVVALVGGVIATGGAILAFGAGPAIGGLVGGYLGGKLLGAVGGELGNKIGGYFGNAQLGERIGEVTGGFIGGLLGGMAGAHVAGGGA
ncbi:MAG: PAAR domain-containing protein, partial [Bryobacteraceae bacterium]